MDCGSAKFRVLLILLLLAILAIIYKSQNLLEISLEVPTNVLSSNPTGIQDRVNNYKDVRKEATQRMHNKLVISAGQTNEHNKLTAEVLDISGSEGNENVRKIDQKFTAKSGVHVHEPPNAAINNGSTKKHTTAAGRISMPEFSTQFITNKSITHNHTTSNLDAMSQTSNEGITGSNFMWVDVGGDFLSRVVRYNNAIAELRHYIQDSRKYKPWQEIIEPLDVLWCNRDDWMEVLRNYNHVKTVLLKWHDTDAKSSWSSVRDHSNVLVKQYYQWTATEPLCKWIATPGGTKARWDAVYNRTCNTDMELATKIASIEPLYFNGKPINVRDYWPNDGLSYPPYFYSTYPDYLMYMHVIEDAIIAETGDVISHNLKLVPYACSQDTQAHPPPGYETSSIYSEVFLVTQFWGGEFFHSMIEGIPRLAPYMKLLLDNPSVLIHVAAQKPYLKNTLRFLGINPERLVSGVARAKILYVPQATPCGFAQIHELQILNRLYTSKLQELHPNSNNCTVIFIRRSGIRKFRDDRGVEETVAQAAKDFSLPFRYVFVWSFRLHCIQIYQ